MSLHGFSSVNVHGVTQSPLHVKTIGSIGLLLDQTPVLRTSFNLNYSIKVLSPEAVMSAGRVST